MKRVDFIVWFLKVSEKMTVKLPDWMTGSSETMRYKYRKLYGDRDCHLKVRQNKTRIMAAYLCITILFLTAVISGISSYWNGNQHITRLPRPEPGSTSASIPVEAKIKYQNWTWTEEIILKVNQKQLTEEEKRELLDHFKKQLGSLILGENKDFNHISKPLNLVEQDPDTGITIEWRSSEPDRINEKGEVDVIGAEHAQHVELQADMTLDGLKATSTYLLKIDTGPDKDDVTRSIFERLENSLDQKGEENIPYMILPTQLSGGIEIRWFARRENSMAAWLVFFIVSILIVYFQRYGRIEREIKEAEESLLKELPEFINKLVMLLNAGLVVSTAFAKIVNDYEPKYSGLKNAKRTEKRYLYEELTEIHKRMKQSNTSLIKELTEFSKRSGVREMVRITAVISDNWNKGSLLAEKLEGESGMLWHSRKKRAEEKGRLAETKLTLPLMILLIVLIMVTIAPAMMEM